ncbi:Cytochrome P450 monooxygenase [Acrodontium crateriforme]|uniref:Cytochrome P450 monooxygenase n=1 Tax=Acrodontium crateriforme TaxID=150365 RepID=A0AAQ3M5N3_9PEZI|nr:Cytochrome P450 monooxygenase [Acrodontium crateriforme]
MPANTGPPTPLLLVAATTLEAFVAVTFLARYVPDHGLLILFTTLLAVNVALLAVYNVFIYPFFVSPLRHLPTPKGALPVLGHGLTMFSRPAGKEFSRWMATIPNDGLIYFRGFFNTDRLLITDIKAIGEILVTKSYDFEKPPPIRNFLRRLLGDGLIIVEGDQHRFLRKTMLPSFGFRSVKDLYPIFWDKSVQFAQGVTQQIAENPEYTAEKTNAPTSVVEVNHWANQVTMDIIGMAAMGRDFNALKNGDDPLIQNYEELLEPILEKQIYFAANLLAPMSLIDRLPWKVVKTFQRITGQLNDICLQLVRDKKAELEKATDPEAHKDVLSHLIRTNSFTDKQMVDQMLTFLAAGHETTSSTLTWTAYLLAKHPNVQTALREEVRTALPFGTQPFNKLPSDIDLGAILESLPLLNGVCNEVSRLYPTVPNTVRTALQERTLLGQVVPKGTEIILSPAAINVAPSLWGDNAADFVPERWIDTDEKGVQKPNNNGGAPSNYAILTFLHGPRSCIGQGFAKAELRALVTVLCGAFELEIARPDEEVIPHGVVTTKPKHGMNLRMKRLAGWE